MLIAGHTVVVPEIVDYEIRRELIRAQKSVGVCRLDAMVLSLHFEPLTRAAMQTAARFWAEARQRGQPTARTEALDIDMILAAQAYHLAIDHADVLIATTNVLHLSRFADARLWSEIT